jgi:4-amino-4-deoxy-L-arabinose transferase-like glycosyltransferase
MQQRSLTILVTTITIRKLPILILLWALLTAVNINKAYHIDDTFHLEAALWIHDHPATPMSGTINWKDNPTPIYTHNQPPLFFYLLALVISIVGTGEIPLHLFLSIFTFLALFLFDKLIDALKLKNRTLLLLLFGFSPALVVNQNLMTDVPLLALVLGSALFLLKAGEEKKTTGYIISALLMGMGLLIKYSVLPLLIVLLMVIIIRRDYKYLAVLLIPLGMLFLWSVWNYVEYGSVHFLDRPKSGLHINRLWSFMAAVGSMAFFSASMLYGTWAKPFVRAGIFIAFSLFLMLIIVFALGFVTEPAVNNIFNVLFVLNGLMVFFLLVQLFVKQTKKDGLQPYLETNSFIIFLFAGSMAAFMVLFAPFMATRHILLILPFVLLFTPGLFEKAGKGINRFSLIVTVILGVFLGISDYKYAGYYRKMAARYTTSPDTAIWTAGHWGWQWYTSRHGLKQYETGSAKVRKGDLLIYPGNISRQEFEQDLKLEIIEKHWEEATPLTFFSGNNFASLYSSSVKIAPWTLSLQPIDTIYVCRVISNDFAIR